MTPPVRPERGIEDLKQDVEAGHQALLALKPDDFDPAKSPNAAVNQKLFERWQNDAAELGQRIAREPSRVSPSSAATAKPYIRPPTPAPWDATRVVPGGQPEGTAVGEILGGLGESMYPAGFKADEMAAGGLTREEEHQALSRNNITGAPARPLSGAIPPKPVPVGSVAAARGILRPSGITEDEAAAAELQDEIDRQAAAMHTEADKRNASVRRRRSRAPGERD